ncbi:MAG TPA: hypothetical protein ACFYEM_11480, partial [Candidatus Hypogeohydataceae bacterium YC40]
SGQTQGIISHFQKVSENIISTYAPAQGSLIIDVGSNDGTLLRCFKNAGYKVHGIDPAKEIAKKATESGIETSPTVPKQRWGGCGLVYSLLQQWEQAVLSKYPDAEHIVHHPHILALKSRRQLGAIGTYIHGAQHDRYEHSGIGASQKVVQRTMGRTEKRGHGRIPEGPSRTYQQALPPAEGARKTSPCERLSITNE